MTTRAAFAAARVVYFYFLATSHKTREVLLIAHEHCG